MRSSVLTAAVFVVVSSMCSPTSAQPVSVWGTGQDSCGAWLAEREAGPNRNINHNWVLGFLTGYNWYHRNTQATPPDAYAVAAFVDQYCQQNPLKIVSVAAAAAVKELTNGASERVFKR